MQSPDTRDKNITSILQLEEFILSHMRTASFGQATGNLLGSVSERGGGALVSFVSSLIPKPNFYVSALRAYIINILLCPFERQILYGSQTMERYLLYLCLPFICPLP